MSSQCCWARQPNDSRCDQPALSHTYFCSLHACGGSGPLPSLYWRAPEAEMPSALVAAIRFCDPEASFPGSPPRRQAASDAAAALPAPPTAAPGPATLESSATALPPSEGEPESFDWLLAYLREAITGLMAGEATPLQKANAVARLGSLYLKTAGAADLKRENKALTRRIAELEQQAAAAEARLAESETLVRVPPERHETIAAAPARKPAPHRPPGSHASSERGPSSPIGPPDDTGDDLWDADDAALSAAAPRSPA